MNHISISFGWSRILSVRVCAYVCARFRVRVFFLFNIILNISCNKIILRCFWNFVASNQWVDTIKITSGLLLENLVYNINKLIQENEAHVYKSVEYHPIPANLEVQPDENERSNQVEVSK